SCPNGWDRLARVDLADLVAPILGRLRDDPGHAWAPELLSTVIDHLHGALLADPVPIRYPTDPRVRPIADAITADPANDWELVDWAPLVGSSERTLRRLFLHETGLPFGRWRFRVRAQTAIRLLRGGAAVNEVARRCGYGSGEAFSRAFRAELGMAPTELVERGGRTAAPTPGSWPSRYDVWPRRSDRSHDDAIRSLFASIAGGQMSGAGRRGALLVAASLLVMAACGDDDDGSAAAPATSEAAPTTIATAPATSEAASTTVAATPAPATAPDTTTVADTEPGTRTFVDSTGTAVEVPANPQRIVPTERFNALPQLLELGAPLAGVVTEADELPSVQRYFAEEIAAIDTRVGSYAEINLEAIAAAEPDLIVLAAFGDEYTQPTDVVEGLQQIAPTVAIDTFRPVEPVIADFVELLGPGYAAAGEALAAEFGGKLAELEEVLAPYRGELTVATVESLPDEFGGPAVYPVQASTLSDVLDRADVEWAEVLDDAAAAEDLQLALSEEEFGRLESDLLLIETSFDDSLLDSPIYQNLTVAQEGQTIVFDTTTFGSFYENYIWVADQLIERISGLGELRTDIVVG
ncbi:MAG: AraC family transcriptional regulator, partial [Actinomycetota bacterium]